MMKTNCKREVGIEVAWGDMDALSHVNNINYFKYFETARIDYFNLIGLNDVTLHSESGPILANISCQYLRPLTFPDTLIVGTSVTRIGNTSFGVSHEIYSTQMDVIAATGEAVIVLVNYKTGAKISVSDDMRRLIENIEGKSF